MLTIAIVEATAYESDFFKNVLTSKDIALIISSQPLTQQNVQEFKDVQILCVFIRSLITKEMLEQLPNLALIITRSTGYDHIDMQAACARSITICNTPIYATTAVAEYTIGLMMSLLRKITEAFGSNITTCEALQGIEVKNKVLGIVGTGNIGKEVIKLARCLGMKVIAYDIRPDTEYAKQHEFEYVSYDTLLSTAEVISFHVMLTPQTTHMLNLQVLPFLKKGVYIINTARGAVIDSDALVQGLRQGIIKAAALDVLQEEDMTYAFLCARPDITIDNISNLHKRILLNNIFLMRHPAVIITPHIAFNTCEAQARQLQTTADIIRSWQSNKVINNIKC